MDDETQVRVNPISDKLNRALSDNWIYSWLNYSLLGLSFVIFVLLELVKVRFNFEAWLEEGLWLGVVANVMLQAMVLIPMINEGEQVGLKSAAYTDSKVILMALLSKVRMYGHTNKFTKHLQKYNKEKRHLYIEETLNMVGLTLKPDKGKQVPTLQELRARKDLDKKQIKALDRLIKKPIQVESVIMGDLYTVLPLKGRQGSLKINKGSEKLKLILPKIIIAVCSTSLIALMVMDAVNEPTLPVITLIVVKLFTIAINTLYGFKGGKRLSSELLPLIFNNRIELIKGFAIDNHYFAEYGIVVAKTDLGKEDMLRGDFDDDNKPSESKSA